MTLNEYRDSLSDATIRLREYKSQGNECKMQACKRNIKFYKKMITTLTMEG